MGISATIAIFVILCVDIAMSYVGFYMVQQANGYYCKVNHSTVEYYDVINDESRSLRIADIFMTVKICTSALMMALCIFSTYSSRVRVKQAEKVAREFQDKYIQLCKSETSPATLESVIHSTLRATQLYGVSIGINRN